VGGTGGLHCCVWGAAQLGEELSESPVSVQRQQPWRQLQAGFCLFTLHAGLAHVALEAACWRDLLSELQTLSQARRSSKAA